MKSILLVFLICFSLKVHSQVQVKSAPNWYKHPPKSEGNTYYGAGQAWSAKMNIAEQKAIMAANESIAKQLNPPKKIKKNRFRFLKKNNQVGKETTTVETEETVATLKHSEIIQKAHKRHKDGFIVYILIAAERGV